MKLERLHITAFLGLGAFVWWLVLGAPRVSREYLQPFGTVVGFLVAFGAAFEFLLWRWFWLHGWFVKRPDLRGTWRVELQSDWINPATNLGVPLIVCYMGVAQTPRWAGTACSAAMPPIPRTCTTSWRDRSPGCW